MRQPQALPICGRERHEKGDALAVEPVGGQRRTHLFSGRAKAVTAAAQASTVFAAGCPKAASSSSGSRKADATPLQNISTGSTGTPPLIPGSPTHRWTSSWSKVKHLAASESLGRAEVRRKVYTPHYIMTTVVVRLLLSSLELSARLVQGDPSSRRREPLDGDLPGARPGLPPIVRHLHPQPRLRRRAERLRQPDRHLHRDSRPAVQQFRKRLPGDAQTELNPSREPGTRPSPPAPARSETSRRHRRSSTSRAGTGYLGAWIIWNASRWSRARGPGNRAFGDSGSRCTMCLSTWPPG